MSRHFDLLDPSMTDLYKYINEELRRGKKRKSLNNEMKDLKAWCEFNKIVMDFPKFKREPSPEPWIPTDDDIDRVLAYCDRMKVRSIGIRNKAFFSVLIYGGLRIGEMQKLNVEDIRDIGLYVRSEKLEKDRTIGLPDDVISLLKLYIRDHRTDSDPKVLFTTPKGRMTYQYMRNVVYKAGHSLGIPQLHPHSFRHYCATSLLRGYRGLPGIDVREVQIHLGHARLETTAIYTHISQASVAGKVNGVYNARFRKEVDEIMTGSKRIESDHALHASAGI